ncbi:MAG: polysaccharide biosynthesis tyrosine autokinase, partial [Cyanobacteria bacterium J06648_11]
EARTIYTDAAPEMQVLKEQRQNLLSLLEREGQQSQREIISQIRELETREAALQETLQGLNSDVDDLSGVARSYDDIQNELLISSENLNQFIAKREALQIDAAQREIPWELVTPPTTPQPIQSSLLRYLLLGTTLGLLLGVGIALLVDESIGIIHAEDELKRITHLPVLASIPNYEDVVTDAPAPRQAAEARVPVGARKVNGNGSGLAAEPSVTADDRWLKPYSLDPFSESFRTLHTNLRLLGTGSPIRAVAVSSTTPGEGKTTVAMHLAEAAAVAGQRVLLIDADLRNPQIHQYLGLSNEYGLTNLFGGNTNLPVIQKYPTQSNLYVMTAGLAPVEPARLLSSQGLKQLTDQIKTKFDLVIYDTPPLLGQSDALLVTAKADGLLLVTQPGTLKQKELERAMEQLQVASISVLGLVVREK